MQMAKVQLMTTKKSFMQMEIVFPSLSPTPSSRPAGLPPPHWPTRVFAAQSEGKLLLLMRESTPTAHFDLATARQLRSANNGTDFLVLHLSDLIRLAFVAAISDCDALRMEGLRLLQLRIDCFASQELRA
jgi:hypothetical protein